MRVTYEIRDAVPDDYPAIAAVFQAAEPPGSPTHDANAIAQLDRVLAGRSRAHRRVAECDGRVVATCRSLISPQMYHPQKYQFYISVHPGWQRQGLGRALYADTLKRLEPINLLALRCAYREDMPHSERFLTGLGFAEEFRLWESWLDVPSFDAAPFASAAERMNKAGIAIRTLADLKQVPGWERKLHALINQIQSDMPQPEPYVDWPFEEFLNVELNRPTLVPETYFIAVDGDDFIGVNILHKDLGNPKRLNTDDTGVARTHRRRGIATALKVHGIEYARARGVERIYTMNASTNQSMLALNIKLGFQREPAYIGVIKKM